MENIELTPLTDIFLDINEVSNRYKVHPKTIRNWQTLGKFPRSRKFGNICRWKLSTVIAWEQRSLM